MRQAYDYWQDQPGNCLFKQIICIFACLCNVIIVIYKATHFMPKRFWVGIGIFSFDKQNHLICWAKERQTHLKHLNIYKYLKRYNPFGTGTPTHKVNLYAASYNKLRTFSQHIAITNVIEYVIESNYISRYVFNILARTEESCRIDFVYSRTKVR